ncbi:MAG TPA: hypothetical protein VMB50_12885 [Myxococcales bacterium]|nr:hypothetical protein [Myxococcales bacterium]
MIRSALLWGALGSAGVLLGCGAQTVAPPGSTGATTAGSEGSSGAAASGGSATASSSGGSTGQRATTGGSTGRAASGSGSTGRGPSSGGASTATGGTGGTASGGTSSASTGAASTGTSSGGAAGSGTAGGASSGGAGASSTGTSGGGASSSGGSSAGGAGAACAGAGQCLSGICLGDVCCAAACDTADPTCGATACATGSGDCVYPTTSCGACGTCAAGSCDVPVVSAASALQATSTCLTAGSGAELAAVVTVVDSAGQPVTGATVSFAVSGITPSWVESQPVEVASPAGTYYQTLEAPAASGTGTLSAQVTYCSQTVTLTETVPLTFAAPAPATGYGGAAFQGVAGCSPVQGGLRVLAIAAETGAPLAGASVLVGSAAGTPFVGSAADLWPSPAPAAANTATTDAQGYAVFQDFGTALQGAQVVTAGAANRAYVTAYDFDGADVVLALPETRPVVTTEAFSAGLASGFAAKPQCDSDVQVGVALAPTRLDAFAALPFTGLFGPGACTTGHAADVASNMYLGGGGNSQECAECFIGFCAANLENEWALTVPGGSEITMPFVLTPTGNLDATPPNTVAAIQQATWQGIGYQAAGGSGTDTGVNVDVGTDSFPVTATFDFSGQPDPTHTDVLGLAALDFSGGDGTGSLGIVGLNVDSSFAAGGSGSVAVPVATATQAPAGATYLGSVEAEYIAPPTGFTPPADVASATSSVLVRESAAGGEPFSASAAATIQVSGFLNLVPLLVGSGATAFTFADGALNGQTPDYSVSTLEIAHTTWYPQLSCQTANSQQVTATYPQWLVYKPYALDGSGCAALSPPTAGCEAFTLPTLPASFPRAAAGVQQQSGFEQFVGSGKACSGSAPCALAGESCVKPTGSGLADQCMGTSGAQQFTEGYVWSFAESRLGLAPGAVSPGAADFTQALPGATQVSANQTAFP